MKKLLLSCAVLALSVSVYAQKPTKAVVPQSLKNKAMFRTPAITETNNLQNTVNPYVNRAPWDQNEVEMGSTVYDLQSNAATPSNRLEVFSDGTVGATWVRGTGPTAYADRGTGYNYFDGAAWGAFPNNRVETDRSGWPAYCAMGTNGEAFVSHISGTTPLNFYKRATKGTGTWTAGTIAAPAGASGLLWPRMTSSGENNEFLHVIALTAPTGNGGTVFNGQDGALVYVRSTDEGATWSTPVVLEGMGSTDLVNVGGDSYSMTASGSNVAILLSDAWSDLFAMVSHDNGETWEKVMIWEHPYPLYNGTPAQTDTIYTPDNSGMIAFDANGKLHVAFGVFRAVVSNWSEGYTYYPFLNGIAYWNEDMDPWLDTDKWTLDPDVLFETGNLIAYNLDLNGNGTLDIVDDYGDYGVGANSMPQLVIDQYNDMWFVYSAITETYDNGAQQYRHLWMRSSLDGGATWSDFVHLSDDIIHMLDECVFPSVAREINGYDENIHMIYQADPEPGLAVRGDLDQPGDNVIYYVTIEKETVGVDNNAAIKEIQVTAYPNPFSSETSLNISLSKKADVNVEVYSVTGQKVMTQSCGQYPAGQFNVNLNASNLNSGLYFVKVLAGEQSTTTKINVL